MSKPHVHNVNVAAQKILVAPAALRDIVGVDDALQDRVAKTREAIETSSIEKTIVLWLS